MRSRMGELGVVAFRRKLLVAMALVVVSLTLLALYLAERSVSAETEHDLRREFNSELTLLRTVRDIRHSMLAERCRALVRKPRLHAALEDDALDLLYATARDELGDALLPEDARDTSESRYSIRARFYRFLNLQGRVIPPANPGEVGRLSSAEERQLNFSAVPQSQQNGYLIREDGDGVEVIATPIISTETGEPIAALVAGFPSAAAHSPSGQSLGGLWANGQLQLPALDPAARAELGREVRLVLATPENSAEKGRPILLHGVRQMLFVEQLNLGSSFPPAYEIGIYPLAPLLARQWELRRNATLAGALLLTLGIAASFYLSARLASPVRKLATLSAENRALRERAEAALVIKSNELERTARFSADASHQLKTPVAVMRAGLDELLVRDELSGEVREELSTLVHQTFRLSCIIEDLLLLSRLDSGRLHLDLVPVDLRRIVDTSIDDLHLLHENSAPEVQVELPPTCHIAGDPRYTLLIVQNLLDNARKYGTPGYPVRISAQSNGENIALRVANRGPAIPSAAWGPIFERFHRASIGEDIPGHGLGLNLARELARMHGGDLQLVRSDGEWTEFEVRFRSAQPVASLALQ